MPPSIDLNLKLGKCGFAREAGDKMGWEGMAEIYLCLSEQYPELSRSDPPNCDKYLSTIMRKFKLNRFEFANILAVYIQDILELEPDERYPHF